MRLGDTVTPQVTPRLLPFLALPVPRASAPGPFQQNVSLMYLFSAQLRLLVKAF